MSSRQMAQGDGWLVVVYYIHFISPFPTFNLIYFGSKGKREEPECKTVGSKKLRQLVDCETRSHEFVSYKSLFYKTAKNKGKCTRRSHQASKQASVFGLLTTGSSK